MDASQLVLFICVAISDHLNDVLAQEGRLYWTSSEAHSTRLVALVLLLQQNLVHAGKVCSTFGQLVCGIDHLQSLLPNIVSCGLLHGHTLFLPITLDLSFDLLDALRIEQLFVRLGLLSRLCL